MEYINIRRYYDNFHVLNIFSRYSYDKKIIQSKFFIYIGEITRYIMEGIKIHRIRVMN